MGFEQVETGAVILFNLQFHLILQNIQTLSILWYDDLHFKVFVLIRNRDNLEEIILSLYLPVHHLAADLLDHGDLHLPSDGVEVIFNRIASRVCILKWSQPFLIEEESISKKHHGAR